MNFTKSFKRLEQSSELRTSILSMYVIELIYNFLVT